MEVALDQAIADLIHTKALAFDLTEEPKFRNVTRLVKHVSAKCVTPSSKMVGRKLLDSNCGSVMEDQDKVLMAGASNCGTMTFSSVATIHKTPCANVLASTPS